METDPIPGSRRKSGNPAQPFPNLQPTKVMIKIPIRKFQFKLPQNVIKIAFHTTCWYYILCWGKYRRCLYSCGLWNDILQECGMILIWRVWQKAGVSRLCERGRPYSSCRLMVYRLEWSEENSHAHICSAYLLSIIAIRDYHTSQFYISLKKLCSYYFQLIDYLSKSSLTRWKVYIPLHFTFSDVQSIALTTRCSECNLLVSQGVPVIRTYLRFKFSGMWHCDIYLTTQ